MRRALIISCMAAGLAFAAQSGCSSARKSEPIAGPLPSMTEEAAHGRIVFMKNCNECHVHGEAGLGPGINDKPLPSFMIRLQVRNGIGAMPSFPEEDLSGKDLDALVAYVQMLRDHG